MLKLNKITKDYFVADTKVEALKGISISFRKNEFVSILGPSGCGKTTLLNIIGGLDHYTTGDLSIDGVSTKNYTDRDWDTYRNHKIGFIFQSYNLIPHQTILENVELALTISGMNKEERIKKAKDALDKVGLSNQYNKKPNQLSGGQCQRVAIARALVNEPDILLADEPTGALDTNTSVQIMNLIKEISNDKLVIMVTHNPELAEKYSTRIVKLLDGNIIYDSNPYEEEICHIQEKKNKKTKLSFWTAFKLSARNLKSKFKRTLMVCIAGSIGIIGVATVLSVSTGVTNYVSDMQSDMLSGNPITISEEAMNLSMIMNNASTSQKNEALKNSYKDGIIDVDYNIDYLVKRSEVANSALVKNDITSDYVNFIDQMPEEYYKTIVKEYGIEIKNNIYTDIELEHYGKQRMSLGAIEYLYTCMLKNTTLKDYASYVSSLSDSFMQMPSDQDFILSQYDVISDTGKLPEKANEIMIVVDKNESWSDLLLGKLGYYSQKQFFNICYKSTGDEKYDSTLDKSTFTYQELLGKTFTYYPNDYVYNQTNEMNPLSQINPFTYNAYEGEWKDGIELTITCILCPKEGVNYTSLTSGIYYTEDLTKQVINDSKNSKIVNYLNTNEKEGFSSTYFNGNNVGITYQFSYSFEDTLYENATGFVGTTSSLNNLIGSMTGTTSSEIYSLTLRELGGCELPNQIKIYPLDFNHKDLVTEYLEKWNDETEITINDKIILASERSEITYTDNLELVISVVNNLINIVTSALVAFTALSLVVSTVMIAIITYVSVIERVKEIGVIRSLGGRKKDVSRLFNAETFIIGSISGLIGIGITYLLSALINLIVGNITGIYTIAKLTMPTAIIMVLISIGLTLISGLIPAKLAAKKDPVVALRTE